MTLLLVTFYHEIDAFIVQQDPALGWKEKFRRRKTQVGVSGYGCTVGYGNPAQPSCCQRRPPGFLTPCLDKTWARVRCIWVLWFLQGLARRELPIALVSTRPKAPGTSTAHQGHLAWRLTGCFPPISALPSGEEFRYINFRYLNDSSPFWKAYRYQIVELVFCKNIPSSLFQYASLCTM